MKLVQIPEGAGSAKIDVFRRVAGHLCCEYLPTHVIFDATDYSADSSLIEEFRDVAFLWSKNMPMASVPDCVSNIMGDANCMILVWLSSKALAYSDDLFAFVLAHEFRHVHQAKYPINRDRIRSVISTLRRNPIFSALPGGVMNPAEIDADICALHVVESLYGGSYSTPITRCPYPAYTDLLREVGSQCNV